MSAFKTFGTLAIPDPTLVEELDNKFQFMAKCQELGLSVPDFKHVSKNLEMDSFLLDDCLCRLLCSVLKHIYNMISSQTFS